MVDGSKGQTPVEQVIETVKQWPKVSLGPHDFHGVEFLLEDYEFGHIHHSWRGLHINYPRRMRDSLIADGQTAKHPYFSNSGWTNYQIETEDDIDHGLWLLRLAYLYRALTRRQKPIGQAILEAVDVAAELDDLGVSEEIRAIFDDVMDAQTMDRAQV